jgi:hypothetical protein
MMDEMADNTAGPLDNDTAKMRIPAEISPPDASVIKNAPCGTGVLPCLSRRHQKMGLLVFSLLYIPLFAGAFFGFGPMQIMLEESGAYASLCDDADDTNSTQTNDDNSNQMQVCPAQTAQLLTM